VDVNIALSVLSGVGDKRCISVGIFFVVKNVNIGCISAH